ncbi:MAG TPA: two-component regulator propeller domain-containing protein [Chitinophagaceae bacterium]|nr:two-component regulator propeller domain-containing protein [Chitinophagaceae bacterium]
MHDPKNPLSLINNKVRSIFEDSKGNFWVGTAGDGLHTMDRVRGIFQRHRYDPAHPEKPSRPPVNKAFAHNDHITFITEDIDAAIWIGTAESGLNYYDPKTKITKHYELQKDTVGAFTDRTAWWTYTSRDGIVWISTLNGNLYIC